MSKQFKGGGPVDPKEICFDEEAAKFLEENAARNAQRDSSQSEEMRDLQDREGKASATNILGKFSEKFSLKNAAKRLEMLQKISSPACCNINIESQPILAYAARALDPTRSHSLSFVDAIFRNIAKCGFNVSHTSRHKTLCEAAFAEIQNRLVKIEKQRQQHDKQWIHEAGSDIGKMAGILVHAKNLGFLTKDKSAILQKMINQIAVLVKEIGVDKLSHANFRSLLETGLYCHHVLKQELSSDFNFLAQERKLESVPHVSYAQKRVFEKLAKYLTKKDVQSDGMWTTARGRGVLDSGFKSYSIGHDYSISLEGEYAAIIEETGAIKRTDIAIKDPNGCIICAIEIDGHPNHERLIDGVRVAADSARDELIKAVISVPPIIISANDLLFACGDESEKYFDRNEVLNGIRASLLLGRGLVSPEVADATGAVEVMRESASSAKKPAAVAASSDQFQERAPQVSPPFSVAEASFEGPKAPRKKDKKAKLFTPKEGVASEIAFLLQAQDLSALEAIFAENSNLAKCKTILGHEIAEKIVPKTDFEDEQKAPIKLVEYAITKGSAELLLKIISYAKLHKADAFFKDAIKIISVADILTEHQKFVINILNDAFSDYVKANGSFVEFLRESTDLKYQEIAQEIKALLQEPDLDLDKFEEILEENSEPEKYARLLRCQLEGRALAEKKGAAAAAPKGMNLVEYAIKKGSAELLLRILSYNNSSEVAAVFKEAIRNIDFAVIAPERKTSVKGILQRAFPKEFNENPTKDILSKDSKDLKDDEITQYIKESDSTRRISAASEREMRWKLDFLFLDQKYLELFKKNKEFLGKMLETFALSHYFATIKAMHKKGIDVNSKSSLALIAAATQGNLEVAKYLIERCEADVNAKDELKNGPLMLSCFCGSSDMIRLLLEKGAPVNELNNQGLSPLFAAIECNDTEAATLLLNAGADINLQNKMGDSSIATAAKFGHDNMVKLLCERGANINIQGLTGLTPLMISSMKEKKEEMVNILLANGADIALKEGNGATALHLAAQKGRVEVINILCKERGINVNSLRDDGITAFCDACSVGSIDAARALLQNNANPEIVDARGGFALLAACCKSDFEMVDFLLEQRINIEKINNAVQGENSFLSALSISCAFCATNNSEELVDEKVRSAALKIVKGLLVNGAKITAEVIAVSKDNPDLQKIFADFLKGKKGDTPSTAASAADATKAAANAVNSLA